MPVKQRWSVFEKDYLGQRKRIKPISSWAYKDVNTERGTEEFIGLGFEKEDFYKPKPVGTLKRCIQLIAGDGDIVLDSFAGSGTTGQAVLELNKEDGDNRKFILVEMEDYADKITAERVRRVIKGVPAAKNELVKQGLGGTFSYFELGDAIETEGILTGKKLPTYLELARYVFYTATGEEFNESKLDEAKHFVGSTKHYDVYMFYKPDLEYLKQTALTLNMARELREQAGNKQVLVFAPTKYVEPQELDELKIDFCQLPFEIYKVK
jgi:adenine-specific DNA-methyltransferase